MILKILLSSVLALHTLTALEAPKTFGTLGKKIARFAEYCEYLQKSAPDETLKRKCEKFDRLSTESFRLGRELDSVADTLPIDDERLEKYASSLNSLDEMREDIVSILHRLSAKAMRDNDTSLFLKLLSHSPVETMSAKERAFTYEHRESLKSHEPFGRVIERIDRAKEEERNRALERKRARMRELRKKNEAIVKLEKYFVDMELKKKRLHAQKREYVKILRKIGETDKISDKESFELFERGCREEKAYYCYQLAMLKGRDGSMFDRETMQKSCMLGAYDACELLFVTDEEKSWKKKKSYLQISCTNGDGKACGLLANLHIKAVDGIDYDRDKAILYHSLAKRFLQMDCRNEVADSCYMEARLYDKRYFPAFYTGSMKKAIELYNLSCRRLNYDACRELADIYDDGVGDIRPNPQKAMRYHKMLCEQNPMDSSVVKGCDWMSGYHLQRGEYSKALKYLERSCKYGNTVRRDSCLKAARLYRYGTGVSRNPTRAATLYETACLEPATLPLPEACLELGTMLEKGEGIQRDMAKAVKFYRIGCDRGKILLKMVSDPVVRRTTEESCERGYR